MVAKKNTNTYINIYTHTYKFTNIYVHTHNNSLYTHCTLMLSSRQNARLMQVIGEFVHNAFVGNLAELVV